MSKPGATAVFIQRVEHSPAPLLRHLPEIEARIIELAVRDRGAPWIIETWRETGKRIAWKLQKDHRVSVEEFAPEIPHRSPYAVDRFRIELLTRVNRVLLVYVGPEDNAMRRIRLASYSNSRRVFRLMSWEPPPAIEEFDRWSIPSEGARS